MANSDIVWVRHRWNLNYLNVKLKPPPGYVFRSAHRTESEYIIKVVLKAYGSDPIWLPHMKVIEKRMTERITTAFATQGSDCLVVQSSGNIVAVSLIAKSHWTDQNLLTGICVLPEQQRKSLGTYLMGWSLLRLKEMGLTSARVYTEANSVADRKVYPLFDSKREVGVHYPGAQ